MNDNTQSNKRPIRFNNQTGKLHTVHAVAPTEKRQPVGEPAGCGKRPHAKGGDSPPTGRRNAARRSPHAPHHTERPADRQPQPRQVTENISDAEADRRRRYSYGA